MFIYSLFLSSQPESLNVAEIFSNIVTSWYFYSILAIIIAGVFVLTAFKKPTCTINASGTRKTVYIAILVALSFIANAFSFGTNLWKFSLLYLIGFVSGFFLGPKNGFVVGFLGDLMAGIIFPQGVYNPLIGISSGLCGLIPGLMFGYDEKKPYLKIVISYMAVYVLCSLLLNTVATYFMYLTGSNKYPTLLSYVLYRFIPTFITVFCINLTITLLIFKPLSKLKTSLSKRARDN